MTGVQTCALPISRAATAQAKTARAKADSGADLDKRIAKLEKSKSIDDELANL